MISRNGAGMMQSNQRVLGITNARRPYSCAECSKNFKTRSDLIWHAEVCLIEAFENEALSVLSDVSAVRPRLGMGVMKNVAPVGITVKSFDPQPRQQWIKMKVGSNSDRPNLVPVTNDIKPNEFDREITYSEPQTIEGPGGIQLMVTVEKEKDNDPGPPVLDPEVTEVQLEQTETEEEANPDELEDYTPLTPAFTGMHQNPPQVIGALANANDDPYKPKMECPTCGLILYRHNFATHYRIHTGELPFACAYCPKRFRTTSSLKVHTRAHTGEKPYNCPTCSYATITKRNLDRHVYHHHVKTPIIKGPVTRRSRYRETEEMDWIDISQTNYAKDDHHYQDPQPMEEASLLC
ncbi:unnamed protein product [Auanema sp. JU1783]|nr:unnamed protein product [Auanema sp. JU1783]